jgi:hypothetical protein
MAGGMSAGGRHSALAEQEKVSRAAAIAAADQLGMSRAMDLTAYDIGIQMRRYPI